MLTIDLTQLPEFQALLQDNIRLHERLTQLEGQLPEWVDDQEAQRLTGLSSRTLLRLRDSNALEWKQDHGVRYLRASLLAHNSSRAVGRGYASPLRA